MGCLVEVCYPCRSSAATGRTGRAGGAVTDDADVDDSKIRKQRKKQNLRIKMGKSKSLRTELLYPQQPIKTSDTTYEPSRRSDS